MLGRRASLIVSSGAAGMVVGTLLCCGLALARGEPPRSSARNIGASPVASTDTDGDGIPDVQDNCPEVPNPEQADTEGFGQRGIINLAADAACSVFATDLDGDGDADVLFASFADSTVAWHENLGGGGTRTGTEVDPERQRGLVRLRHRFGR
jgi:hypothetical protein